MGYNDDKTKFKEKKARVLGERKQNEHTLIFSRNKCS